MKKIYLSTLSLLFVFGILAGCSQDEVSPEKSNDTPKDQVNETQTENSVIITISENNGKDVIAEEEIAFEEDAVLMEVMEENFNVEGADQGFITSIEGISQDDQEGKYWLYFVNGDMPTVGANEYEPEPGDKINFDLQASE